MSEQSYEDALAQNGQLIFTPGGTSMSPMLRHHQNPVVLLPVNGKRLKKYDIALYKRRDGQYVLHRIVKVTPNDYVCCGDNQIELEPGVTDEMIIAQMVGFYKGTKYINVQKNIKNIIYSRFRNASRPLRRLKSRIGRIIRSLGGRTNRKV